MSGLLVAATKVTSFKVSTPSSSVKSCVKTRSETLDPSPSQPPRLLAIASISSKKITQGDAVRAL